MQNITIQSKEGPSFEISIPAPATIDSFFIFSLHKAGSTLLNRIIRNCCTQNKIPFINFSSESFRRGFFMTSVDQSIAEHFEPKGYCYGGFRMVPPSFKDFDFDPYKKIILVRDPRDRLVSFYYSMLKSHNIPKEGNALKALTNERERLLNLNINDYVLQQAPQILERMNNIELLGKENIKLYRYEDVIFKKQEWVQDMSDFLNLNLGETVISRIAKKYDIIPDKEDQSQHIRKVTPGDHKEKLTQETIEQLNEIFREPLSKYGYL